MASHGRVPGNATKISLHERFSAIKRPTTVAVGTSRAAVTALRSLTAARTQHKASIKNRRLALQMEKRLATSPGLSGGSASGAAQKGKKKSIKQRLGLPTFSTGGVRGRGGPAGQPAARVPRRPQKQQQQAQRQQKQKPQPQQQQQLGTKKKKSPQKAKNPTPVAAKKQQSSPQKGQKTKKPRLAVQKKLQTTPLKKSPAKKKTAAGRKVAPPAAAAANRRGAATKATPSASNNNSRKKTPVTKEDLDQQLDQYMSGSKLDALAGLADVEMK